MITVTQRATICSYDIAILALYAEGVELHPAKREQYVEAARCTLSCRVSHYAGDHWNVVGSAGTVYGVTWNGEAHKHFCTCPATVICYHVYAVRMHLKAQRRVERIEEPPRYAAQCKGVNGIETPLMAGQSHFAPDEGQAFFAEQTIIERGERIN